MAIDTPSAEQDENTFNANLGAIETALEKARNELSAITDAASAADSIADDSAAEYSLHEVQGMGRYAVVRKTGWRPLLKVIHDLSANIDFSANAYPGFDGIITQNFKDRDNIGPSPYLADPLSDSYESHQNLRDNIAAVRNFLMETYYVNTPVGMTPEKAKQAMTEIATFIGKGLNNNYYFLGMLPNHRSGQPFISLDEASAPDGAGAQYIYERILEMHRQSSWMRPFSAVISLFGGQTPPDWMLPPAHDTEFTQLFSNDIVADAPQKGPLPGTIKNSIVAVETLEATRGRLIDQHQISNIARDLNSLGDQLIDSASNMQNVAQLSEPVRRDAIEIAKDILRKLRGSLGAIDVKNGLNLPPQTDMEALGSIKGVAMVYERMVGWARNVDPSIMQHPSVVSGVLAIGQLGYLAKKEATRLAKVAGNNQLAEDIGTQLAKVDPAYSTTSDIKFSVLMDRIESGMNTLLSRLQTISGPGAQIGNSSRDIGQDISQAPTAGNAQHISNSQQRDSAQRSAALSAAQNAFHHHQSTSKQTVSSSHSTATSTSTSNSHSTPSQRSTTSVSRQITQQSGNASQAATTTTSTAQPSRPSNYMARSGRRSRSSGMDPARIAREQQLQREEDARRLAETQRQLAIQKEDRKADRKAAAQMAATKIDPHMLLKIQGAMNTKGLGPVMGVKKSVTPHQQQHSQPMSFTEAATQKSTNPLDDKTPTPPSPYGRGGRGF